jgi:hypothetical protein
MSASSGDAAVTPLTDSKSSRDARVPAPKKTEEVKTKAKTASTDTVAAAGSLSVYFLGGVGDVWVDGKLFPYQPPFDRAPLAAGTHRVSCRMSEDSESHEIVVTIHSGRETVIEYEVGGKPVVSGE